LQARIIFITGTDTGVGKTLLTGLLLAHLRQAGVHALAMKPFCSGDRADVELLHALQDGELGRDEINPFYFSEPLAPFVAARKHNRWVPMEKATGRIKTVANGCDLLLVEGIGGACVPLGKDYLVADLIRGLRCETIVVSTNRLGAIHCTLSTCYALARIGISEVRIGLMEQRRPDRASSTNGEILKEWLENCELVSIPYLGRNATDSKQINKSAKKIKKTLAKLLE
jgi:dethiobiotin synthetase